MTDKFEYPICSEEMKVYFDMLNEETNKAYLIANKARAKGYDPEDKVDIPLARNMAERVEGLISVAAPQLIGKGVPQRIHELEKKYKPLSWEVALLIAEEVAKEKFCKFKDKKEAIEVGIRTGFAYHTVGIVSAPLEGFVELQIKKRKDGKEYLAMSYAGPIRGAGGTAAAFSVVLADYLRSIMGYEKYDPDENEINRYFSELEDYHERVTNLQYRPSEKETKFLAKNLPVEVTGDPTEKIEVSNYKDLPRIPTNRIRGGMCLVMSMFALKAPKIGKELQKWGKEFGVEWEFLSQFFKIQKEAKSGEKEKAEDKDKTKISPDNTFIVDLVGGRPVLTHPLAHGGFRLRYGRSRMNGYSAAAIHPATMAVLDDYVAIGTQLKVERPGKAAAITVCDTIEGPIVLLNNGNVIRFSSSEEAKLLNSEVKEILYLGDILFSYGDFFDRNHPLVPCGYCEEWYVQEMEKATVSMFGALDLQKLSEFVEISESDLNKLASDGSSRISAGAAINISEKMNIPLHPRYTYHWNELTSENLAKILDLLSISTIEEENGKLRKIIIPLKTSDARKRYLELIGLPHFMATEDLIIEKDDAEAFLRSFGITKTNYGKELILQLKQKVIDAKEKTALEILNTISGIRLRDKSGTFIGARMGRPEKAKMRKLIGAPHVLFPVGEEGGRMRAFQSVLESGKINAEFPLRYCSHCKKDAVFNVCDVCGKKTERRFICPVCGIQTKDICSIHGKNRTYANTEINFAEIFENTLKKLGMGTVPDMIKGVKGTSNKDHLPEHFAKGILRAQHNLAVNKDGTTRYDMSEIPLTHFKPKEIGITAEKLKELGYKTDIYGKAITDENQLIELKPQDLILPGGKDTLDLPASEILVNVTNFVDDLLVKFYGLKSFYNVKNQEDLIGHLVIGLAPHISAGTIGRILGFSKTAGILAHPLYHAAMRRDCLHKDTLINIYDGNVWKSVLIGDFAESFNLNKEADSFGTKTAPVNGYKTLSFNKNTGKTEIKNILEVSKHYNTQLIKIGFENGRELTITPDHKIYVKNSKGVIKKPARLLIKNDKIIVPYNFDIKEKNIEEIDILDMNIPNLMVRNANKVISNKIKRSRKYQNFEHRDSWPVDVFREAKINIPEKSLIGIKRDNVSMPRKIMLSNDLLWCIGLYIAEGYARKNSGKKGFYQIQFAATEDFIREKIIKTFKKHFLIEPSGITEDAVIYSSRILYNLFAEYLKCGEKAKEKSIPPILMSLPKNRIKYLLQGYFDGDGSVSLSDNRVCCDSISQTLLENLYFILSRFGIYAKRYTYTKKPGPEVRKFYQIKGRLIPEFTITKIIIPSNFTNKFHKEINFGLPRKRKILKKILSEAKNPYGIKIDMDNKNAYLKVKSIRQLNPEETYCLNVEDHHNFVAGDIVVSNCDGDEACVMLLMDALLNFSRQFLPDNRGGRTMDAPLVLTAILNPSEVDDMVHKLDVVWKYPLEFYEACQKITPPGEVEIKRLGNSLGTPEQYEKIGFTHHVTSMNDGTHCSAYKTLPTIEEKLKGQMELARKIRAVDTSDVARLVIEKHFMKDTRGNLRKFSTQKFRCSSCNESFRRPPLIGKCTKCGGRLIFTISEGSIIKYLEPSISLAENFGCDEYIKDSLYLIKFRLEQMFGKDKEKQAGLGAWFG